MPTPQPDESRDDFVTRCIPIVIDDGTAADNEQAIAVCQSMFDDKEAGAKTNAKLANKRIYLRGGKVNVKAAEGEEAIKGPAKFEVVAYTGGSLELDNFDLPLVVDLNGLSYGNSLIANLDHKDEKRVGHVTDYRNDGKKLELEGYASAATPYRDEVVNSAIDGFVWQASIEADTRRVVTIARDKKVTVNGQEFTGPIHVARKATLYGFAFVSHGADDNTTVAIAAKAASSKEKNMTTEFDTWIEAKGFDAEALNDDQKGVLKAAFEAGKRKKTDDGEPSSLSAIVAKQKTESKRRDAINKLVEAAMRDFRGDDEAYDTLEEMGNKAIDDGTDPERFELQLLRATRPQAKVFKQASRPSADGRVIEAALAIHANLPNIEKHYKEETLDAVDRCGLRHFSLQQLLVRAAHSNGYDCAPGERITQSNLRVILKHAFREVDSGRIRAAQFSTLSLPTIFQNLANKEILSGWTEEDQTWKEIAKIGSVPDFKTMTSYRLTDSLEYELVPKGGEIKHGTLGEQTYTRSVKTYAKMLGLTREDIINDDLGSLDDLRTLLGRGAARKFNNVFWTAFMSNLATTFTTAQGNYISGATTNLGTDGVGLGLGVAEFRSLTSTDGKRIGGSPTILLVPPELETVADRLYTGGNADAQTVANTNPFKGKYRPVVVPQLSDTTFTGNSTTAWYLFRDPSILAAMVASFLNGQQTPTVESTDADFETLGILFRGFHDFGANVAEPLAGVMSKGAA